MADIQPFRAIRYQLERIGSLNDVIAPPYDVISPELQDQLYERHPTNIVRVDLNRPEPGDGELTRYERAAQLLTSWLADGTMQRDEEPGYYVLAQTFIGPDGVERTRTGFFSCVRLTRFGEGPVLPHERTLKGPKLDRLRLFRSTRANLSPVFMMYEDPDQVVLKVLESVRREPPLTDATMDGVRNRMWCLRDSGRIEQITAAIKHHKLYIADGHHRYETGLAYRDERRAGAGAQTNANADASPKPAAQAVAQGATQASAQRATAPGSGPGLPAYESILTFSAAVEDPGMVIFPTHRLVHGLEHFDESAFLAALGRYFETKRATTSPEIVDRLAAAGRERIAFGLVTGLGAYLLTLREDAPLDEVKPLPPHPLQRRLDVTILHGVILEHILGITKEAQASQENLKYSKDAKEAIHAANDDSINAVFLMNPTRIDQVVDISNAGEIMPQKSTFFYPKVPSGLVLYPLD